MSKTNRKKFKRYFTNGSIYIHRQNISKQKIFYMNINKYFIAFYCILQVIGDEYHVSSEHFDVDEIR